MSQLSAPWMSAVLVLGLATACASRAGAGPESHPLSGARSWASGLHRDHHLVGRIWEVRGRRFVDEQTMEAALAQADFVLLGETHDNPDHHLLQARLVRALASAGRQPALALEMLQTDQQRAVNAALVGTPPSVDAIAEAVDWAHGGWPSFSIYRPVLAAGVEAGMPLLAADLPRGVVATFFHSGAATFPPGVAQLLQHAGPLPEPVARAMGEEMRQAHCGQLPDAMLATIVLLQRARDAQLAERLLSADGELSAAGFEQGAILIAGLGHVRTDRAVPTYLAREAPTRRVLAVGLLEVSPGLLVPEAYAAGLGAGPLPFDYVVFTPGAERPDPCRDLRKRHPPPAGTVITARAW